MKKTLLVLTRPLVLHLRETEVSCGSWGTGGEIAITKHFLSVLSRNSVILWGRNGASKPLHLKSLFGAVYLALLLGSTSQLT